MTLIGALLFSLLLFGENELEQQFKQANEAYAAKKYEQAIQGYEAILAAGHHSAALYHNLGNSYYKNQQIGKAILNYERGLNLEPRNADLRYNLTVLEGELEDDFSIIPAFFLSRWWKNAVQLTSAGTWSVLGLLLLWVGIGGVVIWILGKERQQKKRGFIIGFGLLILSSLPFLLANGKARLDADSGFAIVLEKVIPLRSAPDGESSERLLLHEGSKLSILDTIGAWYKVRLVNGEEGWLPMEAMERI